MRSLIRPALFMVARLGLFLAFALWIGSQFWWGGSPRNKSGFRTIVTSRGVVLVQRNALTYGGPAHPYLLQNPFATDDAKSNRYFFDGMGNPRSYRTVTASTLPLFGTYAVVSNAGVTEGYFVALYHCLVATFFALFYGGLKWVYRKRGKEVADE